MARSRAKDRSNVLGPPPRLPLDEQAAYLAAMAGKPSNRAHHSLGFERLYAEARRRVDEIYKRRGLPPWNGDPDHIFASEDGGKTWRPHEPGDFDRSPEDVELQQWWALGAASFGRDSEAVFASDIAAALPSTADADSIHQAWLAGFVAGHRLATYVDRWDFEFNRKDIVDAAAPAARSAGGRARHAIDAANWRARNAKLQRMADAVWQNNPALSTKAVARVLADDWRLPDDDPLTESAIRRIIKKAGKLLSTLPTDHSNSTL
jgi:hypothetical protein